MSVDPYTSRWMQANIPVQHRGYGIDDYVPVHSSGVDATVAAYDFVDHFKDHYVSLKRQEAGSYPADRSKIGKGFMLHGRNGTRKTTLATAIMTDVQRKASPFRGYFIRSSEWKQRYTDTFAKEATERSEESKRILRLIEIVPLLVLDDIGQEYRTKTGFTEAELHELLRRRYESARPTIVTTNVPPEDMREVYGPSFASFMNDAFYIRELLGRDSRKDNTDV